MHGPTLRSWHYVVSLGQLQGFAIAVVSFGVSIMIPLELTVFKSVQNQGWLLLLVPYYSLTVVKFSKMEISGSRETKLISFIIPSFFKYFPYLAVEYTCFCFFLLHNGSSFSVSLAGILPSCLL